MLARSLRSLALENHGAQQAPSRASTGSAAPFLGSALRWRRLEGIWLMITLLGRMNMGMGMGKGMERRESIDVDDALDG